MYKVTTLVDKISVCNYFSGQDENINVQPESGAGEIATDDRVCYACYKSHLIIIKLVNNTVHSTDVDLRLLIAKFSLIPL